MRKSRVLLAGVAVAAAGVATSAFTASNTVPASVAGYGQNTVSGAVVTNIHYVANADDSGVLDAVEFTTSTDVTNAGTRTMVLRTGVDSSDGTGGTVVGDPYDCTIKTAWGSGSMVLTCDTTGQDPTFESFDGVGLTVIQ